MTLPFKPNLDKVSKAVKQFVADVAKTEGNKKKIDTQNEYDKLSLFLSRGGNNLNKDELGYIQGLMIEYQQKQFDDSVTEFTKKEVSKIAKRMGDKKKIDTDEEAQALVLMLRNSHRDLNTADMAYIRNLLISSGYGFYLNEQPTQINIVNVIVKENNESESTNEKCEQAEDKSESKPDIPEADKKVVPDKQPPIKKIRPKRPKVEEKIPAEKEKSETEKTKPTIAEEDRSEGFGLADRVVHELNSHIADNKEIKDSLKKVNPKNAYSFVGKFISAANRGVNDGVFSVADLFNRLTYRDTVHVMEMLLKQAADLKLNDTKEYKELEFCIKSASRKIDNDWDADPEDFEIKADDKAITALYERMSKEYE